MTELTLRTTNIQDTLDALFVQYGKWYRVVSQIEVDGEFEIVVTAD